MHSLSFLVCLCAIPTAEPYRETLISVSKNINPETTEINSDKITPDCPHKWSVKKTRLHGGKQEGVDLVTIDNGKMQIIVVPTRGMGIWSVTMGDIRLGWASPVREIVHPSFVSLTARGGLAWLDGFGEFLCRCGLENNGHPGKDTIVDNTGKETSVDLTLHGKQANLPAQEVELVVERSAPYTIKLIGLVKERMMHGPKLELVSGLALDPGSDAFQIHDVVSNASSQPAEFQILYHANFGSPLLGEGSRLVAPLKRVVPFNDRAAESETSSFATYAGPTPGYVEQVYCAWLNAEKTGKTTVMLQNKPADRGVAMTYRLEALPYLTVWKNTAAKADGYVTGIEPGTNFPYNRGLERKAGRVPKLDGEKSRSFELTFKILSDKQHVDAVQRDIDAIQAGRKIEYLSKPQPPGEPEQK